MRIFLRAKKEVPKAPDWCIVVLAIAAGAPLGKLDIIKNTVEIIGKTILLCDVLFAIYLMRRSRSSAPVALIFP